MAGRKTFNIHDLYPEDYCFDWDAFEADPEHYVFTQDDIAYSNAIELEKCSLGKKDELLNSTRNNTGKQSKESYGMCI